MFFRTISAIFQPYCVSCFKVVINGTLSTAELDNHLWNGNWTIEVMHRARAGNQWGFGWIDLHYWILRTANLRVEIFMTLSGRCFSMWYFVIYKSSVNKGCVPFFLPACNRCRFDRCLMWLAATLRVHNITGECTWTKIIIIIQTLVFQHMWLI